MLACSREHSGSDRQGTRRRPAALYAPQRSPELTRALLTQVNLNTLYLLSRQGWGPDRVLRLIVRTINGIDNATSGGGPFPTDPPEFAEFRMLSDLLASLQTRRITILTTQQSSADLTDLVPFAAVDANDAFAIKKEGLGVRALGPDRGYQLTQSGAVKVVEIEPGAVASAPVVDLGQILRLQPCLTTYDIVEAPEGQIRRGPEPRTDIAITTRSLLEVMYLLSKTVAVPQAHIDAGLAQITRNPDGTPFDWCMVSGDLFRVCVSKHRPGSAFASVNYRGYWFFIKATFNMFNEIFRLQRIGAAEGQPVLTLPIGR